MKQFDEWKTLESDLQMKFNTSKEAVHAALCGTFFEYIFLFFFLINKLNLFIIADNVDTRTVLDILRDLVSNCNVYIRDTTQKNALLLRRIAAYITDILHIFGACSGPRGGIGFPVGGQTANDDVNFAFFFVFKYKQLNFLFIFCSWKLLLCHT